MNSFLLTNGLPCMILAEAPRPNRPKKDESVLHMMSFSCVLLRVFDAFCAAPGGLFLLHRVGHWWCTYLLLMQLFPWKFLLGRGPGLTLEYTWSFALRSCGTPLPAFLALWNRIAGLPWNLGSDNMIAGGQVQLLGLIRWLMWNLVGLWDGGVLIACFLARWNRDRLWSLPSSRRRREGYNSYTGWRKGVFPSMPPGVVKNLK